MNAKLAVVAAVVFIFGISILDLFIISAGTALVVIALAWDNQSVKGKINNAFKEDKKEAADRIGVPCCSTCGVEYAHTNVNEWQPKCKHNKETRLSIG